MQLLLTAVDESPEAWVSAFSRELPGADVTVWPAMGNPEAIEFAVVGSLPRGVWPRFPRLRLIASLFAGQDILLSDPTLPADVPIVRTDDPEGDCMMAEFVVLHVLRHHRSLPQYARAQRLGHWERLPLRPAQERRVGIMGLGVIGYRAARAVTAMGFDVAAWTRRPRPNCDIPVFHGTAGLPAFLARTEILVNLLPLTPLTQNLLDRAALANLPRGAALINLGRGQHVVDDDLLALLDEGHLSAATLDVFRTEPLPPDSPLWRHPAITVTPHAARRLDIDGIAKRAAAQWRRLTAGEPLINVVDRAAGY